MKQIQYKSSELQLVLKDGSLMLIKVAVIPNITGKLTHASLPSSSTLEDKLADTLVTNAESFLKLTCCWGMIIALIYYSQGRWT